MQDLRDNMLKPLNEELIKKEGIQAAMDAVAPREAQGFVIHEGDLYELRDKKGNTFRLRVMNILKRNRIMMKVV